ncbi:Tubulin binding cofactor C [Novymonas esmeraldas]|uniref:Tubulin binding cofactor C n=1 Tax=Novymonas esmeraldas TaxID=1808958 RepID=A0AAW0EQE6_9TRYP
MEFSESSSSASSASSSPAGRRSSGTGAVTVGGDLAKVTGSAHLNSTVRAFHTTTSSERRGTDNSGGGHLYGDNSSLRIQLTPGLSLAAGDSATPARAAVRRTVPRSSSPSSSSSDDDSSDDDGSVPVTQQAPPFFAKAHTSVAPVSAGTPHNIKAFRMVHSSSSSSSASSLRDRVLHSDARAEVAADAGARVRQRFAPERSESPTLSVPLTTPPSASLEPRAQRGATSSSVSSSGSSASELVLQRLSVPRAAPAVEAAAATVTTTSTTAAAATAHAPSPAHHHHHEDPPRAAVTAPSPSATASAALSVHPYAAEEPTTAASLSANTLTDTGRTCTTAGASVLTSSVSRGPVSAVGLAPATAATHTRASSMAALAPLTTPAPPPPPAPASQSLTTASATSSIPSSGIPLPHMPLMTAARGHADVSSLDDVSADEDELNTSEASRAAQAALDAAEEAAQQQQQQQQQQAAGDSSAALSPAAGQSLSITPSVTLVANETSTSLLPPPPPPPLLRSLERVDDATGAGVAHDDHAPGAASAEEHRGGGGGAMRGSLENSSDSIITSSSSGSDGAAAGAAAAVVHRTPISSERRRLLSPAEGGELGSAAAATAAAPQFAGVRRQPPPPPTPSTATKNSPSSWSAVRRGGGDGGEYEDEVKGEDSSNSNSSSSGRRVGEVDLRSRSSSPASELTVEQQLGPATTTHGTFATHATSVEVAQAVVNYSASLLPPTRSSSSSSSRSSTGSSSRRSDKGDDGPDGGGDDDGKARAVSPPRLSPTERVVTADAAVDDAASTTGSATATSAVLPCNGDSGACVTDVGATTSVVAAKATPPLHGFQPAPTPELHGETQTTAAVPTTFTCMGDTTTSSSSRASVVLMPPSPSQPRAAMVPSDTASSSAPSASDVSDDEEEREAERVVPPPPQAAAASSTTAAAAAVREAVALRRVGGGGGSSGSSSASSSSSSASAGPAFGNAVRVDRRTTGDSRVATTAPSTAAEGVRATSHAALARCSASSASSSSISIAPPTDVPRTQDGAGLSTRLLGLDDEEDGGDDGETVRCGEVVEAVEEGAVVALDGGGAEEHAGDPHAVQEAGRWDDVLRQMEMVDCTVVSRVYQQAVRRRRPRGCGIDGESSLHDESDGDVDSRDGESDVCFFKVLSLFPLAATDHRARWLQRATVQRRLMALAQEMRTTQLALDAAGLTAAGVVAGAGKSHSDAGGGADVYAQRRRRTTCSGVAEVYVDSHCRLIAQLESEPYSVPLRHVVSASSATGLAEKEVLALLRTVVCKLATMHNAGVVHGTLHAGNVLLSSYDGDAVLAQPCGLMSQSATLPSDLSVISVARACAMAPYLPRVWGARRLHVAAATSTRLGATQRPTTAELVSYHNLAALGWLRGEAERGDEGEGEGDGDGDDVYVATAADDLYAAGMIAFLLYVGLPPFHTVSLWAAVERLGVLSDDYETAIRAAATPAAARQSARRLVDEFCFGTRRRSSSSAVAAPEATSTTATATASLPDLLSCSYGVHQRHVVGRFRPAVEEALRAFIVDCVEASCVAAVTAAAAAARSRPPHRVPRAYADAQELLASHALFRCGADEAEEAEEADDQMRDAVHRVAYPAFCAWTRAREDCGSAPHLSRLHTNALFSARYTALYESVSSAAAADEEWSLAAQLNPHVAGTLRTWRVSSLSSCSRAVADTAALRYLPALVRPSAAAAPSWLAGAADDAGAASSTGAPCRDDAMLAARIFSPVVPATAAHSHHDAGVECVYHPQLHALALVDKQEIAFSLSRAFLLAQVLPLTDTLVLRGLTDCAVTLLAPFRYVVLDGLERCDIRLGPCEACVLRDVHDCPRIAVAARHLFGTNVVDTHLSWGGSDGGGRPRLERCSRVAVSLYGLAYEGLVEDYTRVGLALEHLASLPPTAASAAAEDGGDEAAVAAAVAAVTAAAAVGAGDTDAVGFRGAALTRRRVVELLATTATSASRMQVEVGLCLAPEAPYAHALLSSNTRYVHCGGDCRGGRSCSSSSGGGSDAAGRPGRGSLSPSPDVFHFFGEVAEKDVVVRDVHGDDGHGTRPVVFLLGALGDVSIERCSRCTIAVAGTSSNLMVSDCHDCQLIFMARESVVERCSGVECVALVTEFLLLRDCGAVRVRPLFLDCPDADAVLRRVVDGSVGGAEEELVLGAYEAGRFDELNAVLRGVGQGVELERCDDVVVDDIGYYYQHRDRSDDDDDGDVDGVSVVTVTYPAVQDGRPTAAGGAGDASPLMTAAAQALAEHLSVPCYLEPLQRYGGVTATESAGRPAVSFHDLLNCGILRLRGALCPLQPLVSSSTVEAADVWVERVQGGALYLEDAVHTLHVRHCVGPLDIVVCAATAVVMEGCVGVQLRVACVDFRASDCAHCHVALHVNHAPRYERCTSVVTSALNITARDYEGLLTAAGVDVAVNLYDAPQLPAQEWTPPAVPGDARDVCAALVAALQPVRHEESPGCRAGAAAPELVPLLMAVLHQPVSVAAPLPGLCVSACDAPFLEELETRVAAWTRQQQQQQQQQQHRSVAREDAVRVALHGVADVVGATAAAAAAHTATPDTVDSDAPPPLGATRRPFASAASTVSTASAPSRSAQRHAHDVAASCEDEDEAAVAAAATHVSHRYADPAVKEDAAEVACEARTPATTAAGSASLHYPPRTGSSPLRAPPGRRGSAAESAAVSAASAARLDATASTAGDGTSIDSSVAAPPLPPGPAFSLDPTNVGASATMDVFARARRDAASAAGAFADDERGRTPVTGRSGAATFVSPTGSSGGSSGVCDGADPLTLRETVNVQSFGEARLPWASSSPLQGSPQIDEVGVDSSADEAPLTATMAHVRTWTGATQAPRIDGDGNGDPHGRPAPVSARDSPPRASSYSAVEYAQRGMTWSSEDNVSGVAGGADGDNGNRRAGASPLLPTNFLHVSQDSSSPRVGLASSPADVSMPPREAVPQAVTHARLFLAGTDEATDVDAATRGLLREVQLARERYAANRRVWESSAPGSDGSGGGLEARVRAAVSKLAALRLVAGGTAE